jgi:hypothetical protein
MTNSTKLYQAYASATLTVSGSVVDYNVKDNSSLFTRVSVPTGVKLRNGSSPLTIKFNASTNDPVRLAADEDFEFNGLVVTNMYVTNSGVSATTVDVFTTGWA